MNLDQLEEVFAQQQALAEKYHPIELLNGYDPLSYPVDIQSRAGQDRLRQFYAFMCEEISEAGVAEAGAFPEEMSDVLHFAIEIGLMIGVTPEEVYAHALLEQFEEAPETDMMNVVIAMGCAMNTLKAKPWKRDPKPTDPNVLKFHASVAIHCLIQCFMLFGLDAHALYFAKHQVNQERIASGY